MYSIKRFLTITSLATFSNSIFVQSILFAICSTAGIAIAQIEPESTVVAQYPSDFSEYFNQFADVIIHASLEADLPIVAIIAKSPVWWTSHAAVDASIWQRLHCFDTISDDYFHDGLYSTRLPASISS